MQYQFRVSGSIHKAIFDHLLPGDGKEAVGIILCGRLIRNDFCVLLAYQFHPIRYDQCERGGDFVHWKTELILPLLEKACAENLSVLKIHSHPGGYDQFSTIDDDSDSRLFPSVYGWMNDDQPHGSCIMLPDGEIFGRVFTQEAQSIPLAKIVLAGDEIKVWTRESDGYGGREISLRNRQTLGDKTATLLKSMRIGIVGASGTGSPTIEQLARLGIGELILCDPDTIELKNLNRILNTTLQDAESNQKKVDIIARAIKKIGFDTNVITHTVNLYDSKEALIDLASCDIVFGCMDSIDGRHLLNQLCTFYVIPYFDLGVKIEADGLGGIEQINAALHYLQPGGSSLLTRGCYSMAMLEAAGLKRKNPKEFELRLREKYIVNLPVDRPAVISINMQIASIAVNEFLDRIHRFKNSNPAARAITWVMITEDTILCEADGEPDRYLHGRVGRGDMIPFLEMPELEINV